MEVKINKEIRDYTEAIFFGLSLRQFIFSALACGIAVGLYFDAVEPIIKKYEKESLKKEGRKKNDKNAE